jgi:hypothetical protein
VWRVARPACLRLPTCLAAPLVPDPELHSLAIIYHVLLGLTPFEKHVKWDVLLLDGAVTIQAVCGKICWTRCVLNRCRLGGLNNLVIGPRFDYTELAECEAKLGSSPLRTHRSNFHWTT